MGFHLIFLYYYEFVENIRLIDEKNLELFFLIYSRRSGVKTIFSTINSLKKQGFSKIMSNRHA